ncbi:MAG: molybdopterin-dependent oxidoreductase [Synergistales bacterium]|nr:molybdopterin-dependent oxidoreductase [Synergistales bacterium]
MKGLGETLGSGAMTNDFDSLRRADVILVMGSNTTETHPVIGSWIKERHDQGATLIVGDPRKTEIAGHADIHLQLQSGSDVALANGLMHVILRDGLHDRAFIDERVEGLDTLRETVAWYTPERTAELTGLPRERIEEAARLYASGPDSAICYTMGITQHTTGTDNVRSLANLALLCGMLGRPGTGVNPLRGQSNVQGACDMGALPNVYTGYQKVVDDRIREKFSTLWKAEMPAQPGRTVMKMMEAAGSGDIRGVLIMGENPMVSDPNTEHVRECLTNLDLLVVQDIFLTETARLADVVLPAACLPEKDGTLTNTTRTVQRVRKAVDAPGAARPDWAITTALAGAMGADWAFRGPEEIFQAIAACTPSYAGISYERLEEGGLPWPCPAPDHPGTPNLYTEGFNRPGGKARFLPRHWKAPHEWPDEAYPFLATTGRLLYHYHTGSMSRRSAPGEHVRELFIEMNPADAKPLGVGDGEMIRVTSRRGHVEGRTAVTDRVPPGTLFIPFHFAEAAANLLTASVIDPDSETPAYKITAVRVDKV